MPQTIKVGIVTGAGGAHLGAYFDSLAQAEEAESVVVADPSGQCLESARKALGEKLTGVYDNAETMLIREQPEMALVTLEAAQAPPAIDAALEANCHVFAEKPACVRAEDFEKLAAKADSKHRHLMLALANRVTPANQEARRIVQAGKIGTVYGLEMHLIADQTRLARPEYHKSWFAHRARAGGGHLIWLGIHWLDLAMYITGSRIEEVAGFAGVVGGQPLDIEDSASVTMRFDNGTFGTLTSGYYLDRGYHSHLKIWGSHGWLLLDPFRDVPLEWSSTKDSSGASISQYRGPNEPKGYPPFVRAAVRACAGLDEAPVSSAEGLHVLKTIFAFYEAAEGGQAQKVS